jgi:hypothetical protein
MTPTLSKALQHLLERRSQGAINAPVRAKILAVYDNTAGTVRVRIPSLPGVGVGGRTPSKTVDAFPCTDFPFRAGGFAWVQRADSGEYAAIGPA